MPNLNYRKGANFEDRFSRKLIRDGHAIRSGRFYASKGITDIWWVDFKGHYNEAQLKFSTNKPYISPKEMRRIQSYAKNTDGQILVWIVTQQKRHKPDMRRVIVN